MAIQAKTKRGIGVSSKELYTLNEAIEFVKKNTFTKFDASMDISIRLGIDPRKSDQMVRGTVSLPHGTGKQCRILVLCTADKAEEARLAGADYVGLDDYIEKIAQGWTDVDIIITMPTVMVKLGKLGAILGPRGLMPNPKVGTVTMDVAKMVKEVKGGKISFKSDKYGIVHSSIGRVSFGQEKIAENVMELLRTIVRLKPASSKGLYINTISISSTMSRGVFVDRSVPLDFRKMKRIDKLQVIESLVEKFSTFGCFYVIDAMGLTVGQVNKFRKSCAERNLIYQVAKNTLIQKALERSGWSEQYADFFAKVLKGFSGVLFTHESGKIPAKVLKAFLEMEKLNLPILKGAVIHGDLFIGVEHLDALSNLKSKDELLSDIISLLKSPISNVIASLQSGERRLVGVVETLLNAST